MLKTPGLLRSQTCPPRETIECSSLERLTEAGSPKGQKSGLHFRF